MKTLMKLFLTILLVIFMPVVARAYDGPNSLGFAERGIEAHRDGWQYVYGGKGEYQDGTRVSDCAGLLYSYFSDLGVSGCYGGCTGQVTNNCVYSHVIDGDVPNIHGLAVTMYDTVDPAGGIYGHIGIYIGGGEVCDNSTYGTNMVRKGVFERDWTEFHVFDLGMRYPVNGWYEFDGRYVHYTNFEYDASTTIDGIEIDEHGLAYDHGELSDQWVSAADVSDYLTSKYEGRMFEPNATVTGDAVRVRTGPTLDSGIVCSVDKGTRVRVLDSVPGSVVSGNGTWYKVALRNGREGYMSSAYVSRDGKPEPGIVTFSVSDGLLSMDCDADAILYSDDMSEPYIEYAGPLADLGHTFKAVGVSDGARGSVSQVTVCSNGAMFTDFGFSDWFAGAVDSMVTRGVFVGTGNGKFSPGTKLTRGQFVMALSRFVGADLERYDGMSGFLDVNADAYYAKSVCWAKEQGIVSGTGDDKFSPNAIVTREQLCTMLARFYNLANNNPEYFADDGEISWWARDGVYACRSNGIVSGVGGNRFDPKGSSTRAQAAMVFCNLE